MLDTKVFFTTHLVIFILWVALISPPLASGAPVQLCQIPLSASQYSIENVIADIHLASNHVSALEFDFILSQESQFTPASPQLLTIQSQEMMSLRLNPIHSQCSFTSTSYPQATPLGLSSTVYSGALGFSMYETPFSEFINDFTLSFQLSDSMSLTPQTLHVVCQLDLTWKGWHTFSLYHPTIQSGPGSSADPLLCTTPPPESVDLGTMAHYPFYGNGESGIRFTYITDLNQDTATHLTDFKITSKELSFYSSDVQDGDAFTKRANYFYRSRLHAGIPLYSPLAVSLTNSEGEDGVVGYAYQLADHRLSQLVPSLDIYAFVDNFYLNFSRAPSMIPAITNNISLHSLGGFTVPNLIRSDSGGSLPPSSDCRLNIRYETLSIESEDKPDIPSGHAVIYFDAYLHGANTFRLRLTPLIPVSAGCYSNTGLVSAELEGSVIYFFLANSAYSHCYFVYPLLDADIPTTTVEISQNSCIMPRYYDVVMASHLAPSFISKYGVRSFHIYHYYANDHQHTTPFISQRYYHPSPGMSASLLSGGEPAEAYTFLQLQWTFQFRAPTTDEDHSQHLQLLFDLPNLDSRFILTPHSIYQVKCRVTSSLEEDPDSDTVSPVEFTPTNLVIYNIDQLTEFPHYTSRLGIPLSSIVLQRDYFYSTQCDIPIKYDLSLHLPLSVLIGAQLVPHPQFISQMLPMNDIQSVHFVFDEIPGSQITAHDNVDVYRIYQTYLRDGDSESGQGLSFHRVPTYEQISQTIFGLLSLYDHGSVSSFSFRQHSYATQKEHEDIGISRSPLAKNHITFALKGTSANDPPTTVSRIIPSVEYPFTYTEIALLKTSPTLGRTGDLASLPSFVAHSIEQIPQTAYATSMECFHSMDIHTTTLADEQTWPILTQSKCYNPCQAQCISDWFCMTPGQAYNPLYRDHQCDRRAHDSCSPAFIQPPLEIHRCGYIDESNTFVAVDDTFCTALQRTKPRVQSPPIPSSCSREDITNAISTDHHMDVHIDYYCHQNGLSVSATTTFDDLDANGCNRASTIVAPEGCQCPCVDSPPQNTCGFMTFSTNDNTSDPQPQWWLHHVPDDICRQTPRLRHHRMVESSPMYRQCSRFWVSTFRGGLLVEDDRPPLYKGDIIEFRWTYASLEAIDKFVITGSSAGQGNHFSMEIANHHIDRDDPEYIGEYLTYTMDTQAIPTFKHGQSFQFVVLGYLEGVPIFSTTSVRFIYADQPCTIHRTTDCIGITIDNVAVNPANLQVTVQWTSVRSAVQQISPTRPAPLDDTLPEDQIPYVIFHTQFPEPVRTFSALTFRSVNGDAFIDERLGVAVLQFPESLLKSASPVNLVSLQLVPVDPADRFLSTQSRYPFSFPLENHCREGTPCKSANLGVCNGFFESCSCFDQDISTFACGHDLLEAVGIDQCQQVSSSAFRNCRSRGLAVGQRLAGGLPECDCACHHFFQTPKVHYTSTRQRCSDCQLVTNPHYACQGNAHPDGECSGCYCLTPACKRFRVSTLLYLTLPEFEYLVDGTFANMNDVMMYVAPSIANDLEAMLNIRGIRVAVLPLFQHTPSILKVSIHFVDTNMTNAEVMTQLQLLTTRWRSIISQFSAVFSYHRLASWLFQTVDDTTTVSMTGLSYARQAHPEAKAGDTRFPINTVFTPHDTPFALCKDVSSSQRLHPCDDVTVGTPLNQNIWTKCSDLASTRTMQPVCFDFLGRLLPDELCTRDLFPFYPKQTSLSCSTGVDAPQTQLDPSNSHRCFNGNTGPTCEVQPAISNMLLSQSTFTYDYVIGSTQPTPPKNLVMDPQLQEFAYYDLTWNYSGDSFNTVSLILILTSQIPSSGKPSLEKSIILASGISAERGQIHAVRIPSIQTSLLPSTTNARLLVVSDSNAQTWGLFNYSSLLRIAPANRKCLTNQVFNEVQGTCTCVEGYTPHPSIPSQGCVAQCLSACNSLGGVCSSPDADAGALRCQCNPGFTGASCQIKDDCQQYNTSVVTPTAASVTTFQQPSATESVSITSTNLPSTRQCANGYTPFDSTTGQCASGQCICHPNWSIAPRTGMCTECSLKTVCSADGTSSLTFEAGRCQKCLCKKGYSGELCQDAVTYFTILVNPSRVGIQVLPSNTPGIIILNVSEFNSALQTLPTQQNYLNSLPVYLRSTVEREIASGLGVPFSYVHLVQITRHLADGAHSSSPAAYQLVLGINTLSRFEHHMDIAPRLSSFNQVWQHILQSRLSISLLPYATFPTQVTVVLDAMSGLTSLSDTNAPKEQQMGLTQNNPSTESFVVLDQVFDPQCKTSGCYGIDNLLPELFTDEPRGSGGLSKNTVIYIAVGVTLGVVLIAFVVLLFVLMYFRKHSLYCFKKKEKGKGKRGKQSTRHGAQGTSAMELEQPSGHTSKTGKNNLPTVVSPGSTDCDHPDLPLPEGWIVLKDPQSGKTYYSHQVTLESSWAHPSLGDTTTATNKVNQYGW